MKYSEFEVIAKENGWELAKGYSSWLYADKLGINVGISKTASKDLNIAIDDVYPILFKDKEFIDACYELAETPLEDREDVKYYTVELPFLNYEDKKIILNGFNDEPFWSANFPSHFTEKEIKELDPRLWGFAVEVENEI